MLGVGEAKRRFAELLDRVGSGERVVVHRRGHPAAVLVPPTQEFLQESGSAPAGLASVAGALADWDDLDHVVEEIYASRGSASDRAVPDLR